MGPKCHILAVWREFNCFDPEWLLPGFSFGESGLHLVQQIEFGAEQIHFALIVTNHYQLTLRVLPINSSNSLLHIVAVKHLECLSIVYSDGLIISSCGKLPSVGRPALSPQFVDIMRLHHYISLAG